jgi:membrane-bound lytic murein transglycosylase D
MGVLTGLRAELNENALLEPAVTQGSTRPQRGRRSGPPAISSSRSSPANLSPLLFTPEAMSQPLTRQYIARYTNPSGIIYLNSIIKNGSIYFPFIRDEIAARGLPKEFIFLPFIESNYLPTARSRSGAMGLWQFMMNSIPRDMKVNDMIDERRDFRKATGAALQKLENDYKALGDWHLALAAYNAGLGGVSRAMQNANAKSYWALCEKRALKSETIHYVPKFLAVAYILSNARKYGLDYWPEPVEWRVIRPGRQASLDILASETGADRGLLYKLNAELLHGITPADNAYELIVPAAQAEMMAAILGREDTRLLQYYRHNVQFGDTLSALSRHFGVSLNLIEQHNPGISKRYLQIGETVTIPISREATPYRGPAAAPGPAASGLAAASGKTHTVSGGDTLWSLATRYGVDPRALAQVNNMGLNEILSIGKVLKIPIIE